MIITRIGTYGQRHAARFCLDVGRLCLKVIKIDLEDVSTNLKTDLEEVSTNLKTDLEEVSTTCDSGWVKPFAFKPMKYIGF
jgi:hypothetical protein